MSTYAKSILTLILCITDVVIGVLGPIVATILACKRVISIPIFFAICDGSLLFTFLIGPVLDKLNEIVREELN